MSGDREAISEQSPSVCEGAGCDELYPYGHEYKEYLTSSPERELSAHSFVKEGEEYEEDEGGAMGDEDEEGKGKEKARGMMRATKGWLTRKGNVKRLVTILGPSSFPLYG